MAEQKESDTLAGVREAWDFWLSQHPESVPAIIEAAVAKEVRLWLHEHTAELIEAIAKKGANRG